MMHLYESVTNRIIELLEKGVVPWRKSWSSRVPMNLVSGKPYRGINYLLLSCAGFSSPYFLTYRQAKDMGGYVRAGEKGFPIVYWNFVEVEDKDTGKKKTVPFMKSFTVFNSEQCGNIVTPSETKLNFEPIQECERIIDGMPDKPKIIHGGNEACYIPSQDIDIIRMPEKNTFESVEEYYSTLFHEGIHSTGHEKRLNRNTLNEIHAFGSETYSIEELIAEIGSSYLCATAGIENKTIENSSSYIAGWLSKLKNDKKLIFTAASAAQKACDYILNVQPENRAI